MQEITFLEYKNEINCFDKPKNLREIYFKYKFMCNTDSTIFKQKH